MIEVRRLKQEDIPDALRISLKELGEDYLSEDDFIHASENGQFCNVVLYDGKVAGFAICREFTPEEEPEVLGLPDGPFRDEVLCCSKSGILDSVSMDDSMKGKGLGTILCQRCYDDFVGDGCGLVCAMAWKSYTGRTNIAGILNKLGLSEGLAIQGYWNRMVSSPEGHHCPECGAPCKCYGVFWRKKIL